MILQIKKKAPNRSISPIFWDRVRLLSLRLGFLKKKKMVASATPPNLVDVSYEKLTQHWTLFTVD